MTSIAIQTAALLVSLCVTLHIAVSFILFWRLAFDGAATRTLFSQPWLPSYCEITGVPLVILGLAMREMDLVYVGGLVVAMGIILRGKESARLPRLLELPLLILAIASFSALLIFYTSI
ncbi:MAG: hypothetical protein ACREDZ_04320 [Kiloniellales bacterium]